MSWGGKTFRDTLKTHRLRSNVVFAWRECPENECSEEGHNQQYNGVNYNGRKTGSENLSFLLWFTNKISRGIAYGRELGGQKFRETAFSRVESVRLPRTHESRRSALQWTKRCLAPHMIVEHLFLVCTKRWWEAGVGGRRQWRNVERFKRTAQSHA